MSVALTRGTSPLTAAEQALRLRPYRNALAWLLRCGASCAGAKQGHGGPMPPKIRELVTMLKAAGFVERSGRGSHRNFAHPAVAEPITISGHDGDDAKHYQVRAVSRAIAEAGK